MPKTSRPKIVSKKHLARLERERRQVRIITIVAIAVIVLAAGLIGYGFLYNSVIVENQPVARVGNQTISTHDWQTQVRYQRFNLINQYQEYYQFYSAFGVDPNTQSNLTNIVSQLNDANTLAGQVLDQMINAIVLRDEAPALGVMVSQPEIDQAVQTSFGYYPNGTPTTTVTPTPFSSPTLNPTELFLVSPTQSSTTL